MANPDQLVNAVQDVRPRFAPGEFDVLLSVLGDPRFLRWCKFQQDEAKEALARIEPRQFLGQPELYLRIATDAQLLYQFWGDLAFFAEHHSIKPQDNNAPQVAGESK